MADGGMITSVPFLIEPYFREGIEFEPCLMMSEIKTQVIFRTHGQYSKNPTILQNNLGLTEATKYVGN